MPDQQCAYFHTDGITVEKGQFRIKRQSICFQCNPVGCITVPQFPTSQKSDPGMSVTNQMFHRLINTDQIMPVLERFAVEGEHFFPDDIATDRTERFMCSEIVREKILRVMQEEIPHGVAVDVEKFKSRMKGDTEIIDISVVIICEKESHKGMIIGKGGERLKQIGTMARGDMEDLLQAKVNLQCFVKVKEDWRNRERVISDLGMYDED